MRQTGLPGEGGMKQESSFSQTSIFMPVGDFGSAIQQS